ncbi:MAG: hypothetical protein LC808_41860, partial [Actinobacteria bacterium]|nr:hypothetical protein [Actinomycetota bacterium]
MSVGVLLLVVLGLLAPPIFVLLVVRVVMARSQEQVRSAPTPSEAVAPTERQAPRSNEHVAAAYQMLQDELSDWPERIPEEEASPPQAVRWRTLADRLRSDPGADPTWWRCFDEMDSLLTAHTPIAAKLGKNPTLHFTDHFEKRLFEGATAIRADAQRQDENACTGSIRAMRDEVSSWHELSKDLIRLRHNALAGIRDDPALVQRIKNGDVPKGYLGHSTKNFFVDPQTGDELVWLQWGSLSEPTLLQALTRWIVTEIIDAGWSFDTVCTLSGTGTPLATALSIRFG